MTVDELIRKLQDCNFEAEVIFDMPSTWDAPLEINTVENKAGFVILSGEVNGALPPYFWDLHESFRD